MSIQKIPVKVVKTESLIKGKAKSIYFKPSNPQEASLDWEAGQHITIILSLEGSEVRRSYSISTAPNHDALLRITVKRVPGGLVSNYLNDELKAGDVVDILAPFGGFKLSPNRQSRKTYYFFAAGSGITPLLAMLESVWHSDPHSIVHLLYGNRSKQSIIFREALEQMQAAQPGRVTVSHVLSKPSMWSGFKAWRRGMIDDTSVGAFIDQYKPYAQDTQYFICGPGTMNQTVEAALINRDVPRSRIHMESYGAGDTPQDDINGLTARAEIQLNGQTHHINIQANQTVLTAAKNADIEVPYSCESGVCGACKALLKQGRVHMRVTMGLTASEVKRGCILTCQSVAQSEALQIKYE